MTTIQEEQDLAGKDKSVGFKPKAGAVSSGQIPAELRGLLSNMFKEAGKLIAETEIADTLGEAYKRGWMDCCRTMERKFREIGL